jgi:hypothetical protein
MFGLWQALAKIVNFCSNWPTGLKKKPNLFRLHCQASKMANYAQIAPKQWLDSQPQTPNYNLSHSVSTLSPLPTSPTFLPPILGGEDHLENQG